MLQDTYNQLLNEECEACNSDARALSEGEIKSLKNEIASWEIAFQGEIPTLTKVYKFKNFITALAFTNAIGELAEAMGHHPDITTKWGSVTLVWYTHALSGLHRNDFRCAVRSDELFALVK